MEGPDIKQFGAMVPMRDGVPLAADLHFPRAGPDGGPYPALLCRTPYGRQRILHGTDPYTAAGYVVIMQDVRGRGDSEGRWRPLFDEGRDGYDTVEWVADQPWCDGRVGTFGSSYPGYVQFAAAKERPPHLRAMAVSVPAGRFGEQEIWDRGVLALMDLGWLAVVSGRGLQSTSLIDWERVYRHLPVREMDSVLGRDMPDWREWIDHPCLDDYWREIRLDENDFGRIDVPVLHVGGWFDANLWGTMFFFEGMRRHSPAAACQALIIGPWEHGSAGGDAPPPMTVSSLRFPPDSSLELGPLRLEWFDRWLKGAVAAGAPVGSRVYETGSHRWVADDTWPVAGPATVLHLSSGGRANTFAGDGRLRVAITTEPAYDEFVYDPEDPLQMLSHWDHMGSVTDPGVSPIAIPVDMRPAERRDDVLVYTSEQLEAEALVHGEPTVILYAASDCPDTDLFCWLTDVDDRGASIDVSHGHVRARFRNSLAREELLEPGYTYEMRVDMRPLAHAFLPGHRIRLLVSSSFFPVYDRNPNTADAPGTASTLRRARNRIHHGGAHPSRVELPVPVRAPRGGRVG